MAGPHPTAAGKAPHADVFGPFLLERRIAIGGSSEVFLARPKQTSRLAQQLVIKRLLPELREQNAFSSLSEEAELNKAVEHPNVVKVYGAGMVGNEPYIALEYVEGVDLYRLLRRASTEERKLPFELAVFIARKISAALGAVHRAVGDNGELLHLLHGDVSPSNIYLSVRGEVKLGDFGIARAAQPEFPEQGASGLKGKFGYLAPEQLNGEPVDQRADLFALAVVLGEMLLGKRIFPGSGQLAILLSIRDANIMPLREIAEQLPPGLFAVCKRALSRDPRQRFEHADELGKALDPFQQGQQDNALAEQLSEWVKWVESHHSAAPERRPNDSFERLTAVTESPSQIDAVTPRTDGLSSVRCSSGELFENITFAKLIEMIATGVLGVSDEVSLMGAPFRQISNIEDLARHALPSSTSVTGHLFDVGIPDYTTKLDATSIFEVMARMRSGRETGALFVSRTTAQGTDERKDIYLLGGRLHHVTSSDREELFGEYLVRRGTISREQLEMALSKLASYGGRLGDTLMAMKLVDSMDVFRALRNQGRDRVAALGTWNEGSVQFYRGASPGKVLFPLDLDLTIPMMAGAISARLETELSNTACSLRPGARMPAPVDRQERGNAPASLQLLPALARKQATLDEALLELQALEPRGTKRRVSEREARAAIFVGRTLGWVELSA
jgi:serine/threonine-protein kinase